MHNNIQLTKLFVYDIVMKQFIPKILLLSAVKKKGIAMKHFFPLPASVAGSSRHS